MQMKHYAKARNGNRAIQMQSDADVSKLSNLQQRREDILACSIIYEDFPDRLICSLLLHGLLKV
jgi:hypothetical protein